MSELLATPDGIAVITPYDKRFVDALKFEIPYADRQWHGPTKRWIVSPQYASNAQALIKDFFGEDVALPQAPSAPPAKQSAIIQLMYLGRCKSDLASGYANGSWSCKFPETVLREWFCDTQNAPNEPSTLYSILGVPKFTTDEQAIKQAYRKMAKAWHPDVNREDGARERFEAVQHAYEILGDTKGRKKYDVGLILEERHRTPDMGAYYAPDYRAPLTCGLLMVTATSKLGILHVDKILAWNEILDAAGRTMVSSWPVGGDTFEVNWV